MTNDNNIDNNTDNNTENDNHKIENTNKMFEPSFTKIVKLN